MEPLWKDIQGRAQVARLTQPEEIEALVCLFETIAQEEGGEPGNALPLWQNRSVYFALEVEGQIVGGLQLVLPDIEGALPCHSVWPETPTAPSGRYAHIAILALNSAVRGQSLLFWRLAVEMWRYCVGVGIASLFIEVTPRILPLYRRLGWPLEVRGERRAHWGEDCYLCALGIPEVAQALLRRAEASNCYQRIIAQAFRVTISIQAGKQDEAKRGVGEALQAAA